MRVLLWLLFAVLAAAGIKHASAQSSPKWQFEATPYPWSAAMRSDAHSKDVAIKLGYRYLSVDYDKSGFLYDMDSADLYVGAGFRF